MHDKGQGMVSGKSKTHGMHPDDSRMDPLFEKCAELGMPISLHVADPIWMYQKMDKTNDGLMNAYHWRLDNQPNIVGLTGMIEILERTLQKHPQTTFIACHFANLDYDLARLGQLFDRNSEPLCRHFRPVRRNRTNTALCFPVLCQALGSSPLRHRYGL